MTLRGSGPEQRLCALEDSEADDCWGTKRSYPAKGCAKAAFREFGASAGSRRMLRLKQHSNGIRVNTDVAGPAGEYKKDGDLDRQSGVFHNCVECVMNTLRK